MEKILREAKGANGQLELLDHKIRIKRKGFMAFATQGLRGDKEILIKHISSIQIKKVSLLSNGYIQFSFLGGSEHKGGFFSGAEGNIAQDENTIIFTKRYQKEFEEIKEMIEAKMSEPDVKKAEGNNLDDLEKLADLKDKGIITEEEFIAKKKQILGI